MAVIFEELFLWRPAGIRARCAAGTPGDCPNVKFKYLSLAVLARLQGLRLLTVEISYRGSVERAQLLEFP